MLNPSIDPPNASFMIKRDSKVMSLMNAFARVLVGFCAVKEKSVMGAVVSERQLSISLYLSSMISSIVRSSSCERSILLIRDVDSAYFLNKRGFFGLIFSGGPISSLILLNQFLLYTRLFSRYVRIDCSIFSLESAIYVQTVIISSRDTDFLHETIVFWTGGSVSDALDKGFVVLM